MRELWPRKSSSIDSSQPNPPSWALSMWPHTSPPACHLPCPMIPCHRAWVYLAYNSTFKLGHCHIMWKSKCENTNNAPEWLHQTMHLYSLRSEVRGGTGSQAHLNGAGVRESLGHKAHRFSFCSGMKGLRSTEPCVVMERMQRTSHT